MDANGLDDPEVYDLGNTLSIEFTLLSGETISVRESFEESLTEDTIRQYADLLIREIGTDAVRTFNYWWEDEFYIDAVRMHEVAALSVSTVTSEEDAEEDEDWEP